MKEDAILQLIDVAVRNKGIELDLSDNQLTSLPPEIGKLTNLSTLNLSGNQLTSLPPEIGKLTNLSTLNLSGNQLTSLPPEIKGLINLAKLFLLGNQLKSLPSEIGKLKNLSTFDLSGNQLKSLPSEIGELSNIFMFGLSNNLLISLPPAIGKLTNLYTLALSGNQITSLPQEIGKLNNLRTLNLYDNPLTSPPPEIAERGIGAIFEYLRRLSKDAIEHNEAKLILVGQGDVGKTCLAKRLIYDKFVKDKSTEGIDILEWKIMAPTSEQKEIKLNVWDFGGQEIYHATHQFFLTKRSIYLLVWNARKSRDYEHIYYWLHTIEAFGEDSPIILVMSKLNERNDDLNMKDLREKFPQIVDLYKIDSEDGKGISLLKEIIRQTSWNLPHMRTQWVKSWFKARELLERDGRDWIEYKEFYRICRSQGLDKTQIDILDEYLHDIGIIIHFHDRLELRDMVILKPEWATKAVYKILSTHSVLDYGGVLLHNELEQIWDTTIYPHKIHSKLLELMNKFELAYELPNKKSHLVAELLPSTEPKFSWESSDNLIFYYSYDFIPSGVMTRFIVRIHQDLEKRIDGTDICWREGAVLSREGTRAFIKVKPLEKLIEIKISGNKKRELLAIVRYHFDHINEHIKKVKIEKKIPCMCSKSCAHKFDYNQLLIAEKYGKETVDCPISWNEVSLSLLLDGYKKKENRMEEIDGILKDRNLSFNIIQNNVQKVENKQEVKIGIDIKIDLPLIQSNFDELKNLLLEINPNLERNLKEIGDSLDEVNANIDKDKLNKPFNKMRRFLEKLADKNSDYNKIISGSQKGIELARKIGKSYNKFAQWLALPQVPDLFLE